MAAAVGTLGISLTARTGQFDRAMRRAGRAVGKFRSSLGRLSGVASLVAGGGVGLLVTRSFQAIDAQAKLSDQLGFQQERLAGLQHAANLAGVSTESISKSLGLLGKNAVDAANGFGVAKDSFDALGIDAKKLISLSVADQFDLITDAIGRVDNASQRISIVRNIFGRSGQELLSLMKDGTDGLRAAYEEAKKLGLVLTRLDSAKVEEANDSITKARALFSGLAIQFSAQVAPVITAAAQAFLDWGTDGEGASAKVHSAITQVINVVGFLADAWRGVASSADIAAAAMLGTVAIAARYNPAGIGFETGFEVARATHKFFGGGEAADAAVSPIEEFVNNLNGAAQDLIDRALERSGTSVTPVIADFFKSVTDEANKRLAGATPRPLAGPGVEDTQGKIGSFKEVDLRRIALGGIGSSGKAQEVHDPANEKIIELLRSMANGGSGAVAV